MSVPPAAPVQRRCSALTDTALSPHARRYFATAVRTKLVLDLNTEDHIELAFNITMDGLPCRFTSVDFFDETGALSPPGGRTA